MYGTLAIKLCLNTLQYFSFIFRSMVKYLIWTEYLKEIVP